MSGTIVLNDVDVRLGDRQVLQSVSLYLTEQRIGVIGANGSGKSTLARLLNGLVTPTRGTVRVDGLDTVRDGAAVRRRVGFVFTDPDAQILMPTVGEDVEYSLARTRRPQERAQAAMEALRAVGLGDHYDHPAHLLSGGQKQLLALTSVLIANPQIVVADEPTTLLDLRNTRDIATRLLGLDQRLVLVSHDLDVVAGTDRVIVVDEGRIMADDEPKSAIAYYRRLMS